jgi:hypothetical protein
LHTPNADFLTLRILVPLHKMHATSHACQPLFQLHHPTSPTVISSSVSPTAIHQYITMLISFVTTSASLSEPSTTKYFYTGKMGLVPPRN